MRSPATGTVHPCELQHSCGRRSSLHRSSVPHQRHVGIYEGIFPFADAALRLYPMTIRKGHRSGCRGFGAPKTAAFFRHTLPRRDTAPMPPACTLIAAWTPLSAQSTHRNPRRRRCSARTTTPAPSLHHLRPHRRHFTVVANSPSSVPAASSPRRHGSSARCAIYLRGMYISIYFPPATC